MAPDRTILHLFKKKIPDPLPLSRIMACTLLSLSYAPVIVHLKVFICAFYLLSCALMLSNRITVL